MSLDTIGTECSTSSRRSSHWNSPVSDADDAVSTSASSSLLVDARRRSGSFSERDSLGDATSLSRSAASFQRRFDFVVYFTSKFN